MNIQSRVIALEKVAPRLVYRPDGMSFEEFFALMCASLTSCSNGQARRWLDAMTLDEVKAMCDELEAYEERDEHRSARVRERPTDDTASEGAPR